jgi:hypothetical protein
MFSAARWGHFAATEPSDKALHGVAASVTVKHFPNDLVVFQK